MGGNFKVRALKTDSPFFNKGDIIEFKNGRCRWSDGGDSDKYENFEDLIDDNGWTDYLEEIKESSDLRELIKPCYVVVRRDGSVCGIFEIKEGLVLQSALENLTCEFKEYNENLTKYEEKDDTDIMEVYRFSTNCWFNISRYNRPLIWKREEEKTTVKSPTELEIELIEEEQRKLSDRLSKLKESL